MVARLRERTLSQLTIDDERAFRGVALYAPLKEVVVGARYRFRVLPRSSAARWDRALMLNLTFWGGHGGDVLPVERISADVVTHVAWHHLAARAFAKRGRQSVDALLAGEAIASAFDVFMVGSLLRRSMSRGAPRSAFLESQVPAMAETAQAAGLSAGGFEALLGKMATDPSGAFESLRALLVDVTRGLAACTDAGDALAVMERSAGHPFAPLLHRFELSNWVLWCRAWAPKRFAPDARVRAFNRALRAAPDPVAHLAAAWLRP